jgi:hypothetical protein
MEVKNKKTQYQPIKKVNDSNVIIMWDYKPVNKVNAKGEIVETPLAVWKEHHFNHIPSLNEVKNIILTYYNQLIDQHRLSGLTWNNMQIWLSTENQFNYKVAYDLAVQTSGATLPLIFKFGDDENVIYYEFKTLDELYDFYIASINHVQFTLAEGWKKKDSINWCLYEIK